MESSKKELEFEVNEQSVDLRIDMFLAKQIPNQSRTFIKKLIEKGKVTINDKKVTPHLKLALNQIIKVELPPPKKKNPSGEDIKLDIVYENDDLLIVNKPAGMVVHPTDDGRYMEGSLVNALLFQYKENGLSDINGNLRPGIVHRLDKDTSGLIIIAKNNEMHRYLAGLFQKRKIKKTYIALVKGALKPDRGTIHAPLARGQNDRTKMYLASENEGKEAISHYKVLKIISKEDISLSLIEVKIETGRTHQIRVHFNSIGHPVIGDLVYGDKKINEYFSEKYNLKRQFLHASEIKFLLQNKEEVHLKTELPEELNSILSLLSS